MKFVKVSVEFIIKIVVAVAQAILPFLKKDKDNSNSKNSKL